MSVKTTNFWSNYLLLLVLVTAFPSMQWTPAHIHLSVQHDHDELHHQHQAEIHAHNLANQTVAINASHQISHANIIMLVDEYNSPKQEKQKNYTTALVASSLLQPFFLVSIKIPTITNTKSSYFDLSTVNPRAPPQIS